MARRSSRSIQYVDVTPTVDLAAYGTGDLIGHAVMEFNFNMLGKVKKGGFIRSVIITDLAKQSQNLDVVFWATEPTGTTFTDQAALDIADADLVRVIGVAAVTDWKAFADNSIGQLHGLDIAFVLGGGNTLYASIVSRGTPDFVSTSDLTVRVGVQSA